jgi:phasin family protein
VSPEPFIAEDTMQSFPSLATTPALKSYIESQLVFMTELSIKLCDSVRKVSELNLRLAQQLIEDSVTSSRQMINTTGPVEFASAAMAAGQPMAERMRHYNQQLLSLLAGAQVELTRTAESHIPEASRNAAAMADELVRKASEETERATERQRSAIERMSKPLQPQPNGIHNPS